MSGGEACSASSSGTAETMAGDWRTSASIPPTPSIAAETAALAANRAIPVTIRDPRLRLTTTSISMRTGGIVKRPRLGFAHSLVGIWCPEIVVETSAECGNRVYSL
jgi:hypothetical protein